MAPNVPIEIVERYLRALHTGELDDVPLGVDATFESPLSARGVGRKAVLGALRALLPAARGMSVRGHIADGREGRPAAALTRYNGRDAWLT